MLYSSIENKKIKEIKKLYQKKYRDLNNKFIIEGEHLVIEAHKKGLLEELILEEDYDFDIDVNKSFATKNVLKYISELDTPSKVIGICQKINEKAIGNKVLILDGIQDPGNLGTIIRSSVAFNIDTIILSSNTVDLYNPKVVRATQGMLFHINIMEKELKPFILELKEKKYQILSTKVDNGVAIQNVKLKDKFCLVMGSEGSGVSSDILKLSDEYVYINMNKNCESLNVAVATSIILYELNK